MIGNSRHTVPQVRLRRSLHRDTLFASGRKISMGAHLYRRTGRRDTTTDAKITFEADIPSRERQFSKPRGQRAGCACPANQHKHISRGSLATVGLLQNWGIRRGPVPERVRRSRECRAEREKRRRAADVVTAGAIDATRAGTHFVERTGGERGGKGVRDQPRGRHPMATSIFTQYPIQDLYDHTLRYVSMSKIFFFIRRFRGSCSYPPLPRWR